MSNGRKRQINELQKDRNNKLQKSDNEQISPPSNLQKCSICNRRFTENRLIDHERACKVSRNSLHRYHYNSQLHRWKGLDYRINSSRSHTKRKKLSTHWREKHQQFQDAVKGEYNPINDSIQSSNDRPYQCSQCQRKFATKNAITKHQKGCTGNRRMGINKR